MVTGHDLAVATSGTAERGPHILDPRTGRPATALALDHPDRPGLTADDAYATAAFAMGDGARDWVEAIDDYEALGVTATGGSGGPAASPPSRPNDFSHPPLASAGCVGGASWFKVQTSLTLRGVVMVDDGERVPQPRGDPAPHRGAAGRHGATIQGRSPVPVRPWGVAWLIGFTCFFLHYGLDGRPYAPISQTQALAVLMISS